MRDGPAALPRVAGGLPPRATMVRLCRDRSGRGGSRTAPTLRRRDAYPTGLSTSCIYVVSHLV